MVAPPSPGSGSASALLRGSESELRGRYEEYRRRQSLRLLSLMPREAVRPLYRKALDEAAESWEDRDGGPVDPMGVLLRYCRRILPLPTFEAWLADVDAHPAAHLDEGALLDLPALTNDPITVEIRKLEARGERWYAALDVRCDADGWKGRITFQRRDDGTTHRTGEIFQAVEAQAVRQRFLEFDGRTLEAFLRSALP